MAGKMGGRGSALHQVLPAVKAKVDVLHYSRKHRTRQQAPFTTSPGSIAWLLSMIPLLLLAQTLLASVNAYPDYWINPSFGHTTNSAVSCKSQPNSAASDSGQPNSHSGPVNPDPGTSFILRGPNGVTQVIGAGITYNVTVSFAVGNAPQNRRALLTANYGTFSTPTDATCSNRIIFGPMDQAVISATYTTTLAVPCSPPSALQLHITSANNGGIPGAGSSWYQSLVTFFHDRSLDAGACVPPSPPTPPPPPPRTLPLPPSPPTPPPPVPPFPSPPPAPPFPPSTPQLGANTPFPAPPPAMNIGISAGLGSCSPSTLGYDCASPFGKVIIHWSVNKTSAPNNTCTGQFFTNSTPAGVNNASGLLHMAVEGDVKGYVGFAFATRANSMPNSDIIIGWVNSDSTPNVKTYSVNSKGIYPSQETNWAYSKGVVQTGPDLTARTTICFSRQLQQGNALYSPLLDLSTPLLLNWAIDDRAALVQHSSGRYGGGSLDLLSGQNVQLMSNTHYWINVHGALMAVAWGLLLPLGTLAPAHRWWLGDEGVRFFGKGLWFLLHIVCQLCGMALFIAGFVVANVKFSNTPGGRVGTAHKVLGYIVMGLAGAQVIFAFIRPAPGSPRRGLWNLIHHNLGRITIIVAWVTVYLGVSVYYMSSYFMILARWLAPIVSVMACILIIHLLLIFMRPRGRRSTSLYDTGSGSRYAIANGVGVKGPRAGSVDVYGADGRVEAGKGVQYDPVGADHHINPLKDGRGSDRRSENGKPPATRQAHNASAFEVHNAGKPPSAPALP